MITGRVRVFSRVVEILPFAHRKIDFDGIERGYGREQRALPDEIADLRLGNSGDPVDQRNDFGKPEVQLHRRYLPFGRLDPGLGGCDLSLCCAVGLHSMIIVLL